MVIKYFLPEGPLWSFPHPLFPVPSPPLVHTKVHFRVETGLECPRHLIFNVEV